MLSPAPALHDIIFQHANEAAFLWDLRETASLSRKHDLEALCELDNRLYANIEGLELAGETGWDECKPKPGRRGSENHFVAAVIAFGGENKERIALVLEKTGDDPELQNGIISALGWLPYGKGEPHIKELMNSPSPIFRAIAVAASSLHGIDPGEHLTNAVQDANPSLRARAIKAAGKLGRADLLAPIRKSLNHEDPSCRFHAGCSATLLGSMDGLAVLQDIAASSLHYREEATKMVLRRMNHQDAIRWQAKLADNPETHRLAIIGAGVIGDPSLIPCIIQQMNTPELARVAGEAFTMITGVDIAYNDLEGEWPEGFEAGPNDDPEDENVEMDADEDLPWPNPELISGWWENNKNKFNGGTRHLAGLPVTQENLRQILATGNQRQRHAAAVELAMLHPGQPLFEVRAPGFRQKRLLAT